MGSAVIIDISCPRENAKRYLQPINKWEYEEDAFVEIINNLSKILSK